MVSTSKCKKYMDGLKNGLQVGEFFRQVEAGVVSNSRIKIYQTWSPHFSPPLYCRHYETLPSPILSILIQLVVLVSWFWEYLMMQFCEKNGQCCHIYHLQYCKGYGKPSSLVPQGNLGDAREKLEAKIYIGENREEAEQWYVKVTLLLLFIHCWIASETLQSQDNFLE